MSGMVWQCLLCTAVAVLLTRTTGFVPPACLTFANRSDATFFASPAVSEEEAAFTLSIRSLAFTLSSSSLDRTLSKKSSPSPSPRQRIPPTRSRSRAASWCGSCCSGPHLSAGPTLLQEIIRKRYSPSRSPH